MNLHIHFHFHPLKATREPAQPRRTETAPPTPLQPASAKSRGGAPTAQSAARHTPFRPSSVPPFPCMDHPLTEEGTSGPESHTRTEAASPPTPPDQFQDPPTGFCQGRRLSTADLFEAALSALCQTAFSPRTQTPGGEPQWPTFCELSQRPDRSAAEPANSDSRFQPLPISPDSSSPDSTTAAPNPQA